MGVRRAILRTKPETTYRGHEVPEEDILLPFGSHREAFTRPNPTMLRTIDLWPLKDDTDPVDGWSVHDVQTVSGGAAADDVHGKPSDIEELREHIWECRFVVSRDPEGQASEGVETPVAIPPSQRGYDATFVVQDSTRLIIADADGYFDRYIRLNNSHDYGIFYGPPDDNFVLRMKSTHTIIEQWPTRLKKQPEEDGAKEEFKTLLASSLSGCERYVE
ncbi:hypothetical protein DL770_003613 [Monosporascus sp. CRB-9-2]|nr:hypothetical protein DL770_003613 [Monosporascus sp. CRB-9-2]